MKHYLAATLLAIFMTGCSIHQYIYEPDDLRQTVEPGLTDKELELLEIPYEVTPEMRAFAEEAVAGEINPIDKSVNIVKAIMSRWVLDVHYERLADFTAPDVFHHTRRANCLSFTHLFVSLARAMDIRAHYVDVRFEEQITEKDVIISNHHICAGVYDGAEFFLIDFDPQPRKNYRVYRLIDDLEAVANHYNNIAINEYAIHRETLDDALVMLDMALKIKPDFLRALNNKGAVLALMDRPEAAEAVYRKALRVNNAMPEANANLAGLLLKQGKFREAIPLSHRAVDYSPNNTEYRYRLALGYLYMGDYSEAYKQFRWIVRRDPADRRALHGSALALYHLGKYDKARELVQDLLAVHPDSEDARSLNALLSNKGY